MKFEGLITVDTLYVFWMFLPMICIALTMYCWIGYEVA